MAESFTYAQLLPVRVGGLNLAFILQLHRVGVKLLSCGALVRGYNEVQWNRSLIRGQQRALYFS